MTIRELLTKWKFEADDKALDKVEDKLDGIKHRLEFLGAVEIVKGIAELTEKFSHLAMDLHEAAGNAGITVESFQKLQAAGMKSGLGAEEMSAAMARLSRSLYDAKTGGKEAQQAFLRAGFSMEQVQNIHNGHDALMALSANMPKIKSDLDKSAIAMELMGRGGYKMVNFLKQGPGVIENLGKEAEDLGAIMSKDQVDALLKAEHAFTDLWMAVKGFANTIAAFLAPEVESAVRELTEFWKVNREFITLKVKEWLGNFAYGLGFLWQAFKLVTQAVIEFSKKHETLTNIIITLIMSFGGLVTSMLIALKVFSMFHTALDTAKKVRDFGKDLWSVIKTIREWGIVSRIATAAQWLWNTAVGVFEGEIALVSLPVLGLIAAIAGLVLVGQALWKVFTGGDFKDTWLGQAWEMLKGAGGWVMKKLGFGGGEEASNGPSNTMPMADTLKMITSGQGITGLPPSLTGGGGGGGSSLENNYQMSAPIQIMTPPGTDTHSVAQHAQKGVKEHMDRVFRETHRQTAGSVAY